MWGSGYEFLKNRIYQVYLIKTEKYLENQIYPCYHVDSLGKEAVFMIKRETYMSRIRPFIGNELIKVLTGIRRSGKSVMLSLIQEELVENGVDPGQMILLNSILPAPTRSSFPASLPPTWPDGMWNL